MIVNSVDPFFEVGAPQDVILARNPTKPLERLGQTSVFRFPVGKLAPLQEAFCADPQGVADTYRFEQRFVTRNAPGGVSFFPKERVLHFRQHYRRPFPLNFWLPPRLPSEARIVIFPGMLLPQHAIDGHWGPLYPKTTPLGHLAGLFSRSRPEKPLRYLRHYIHPAPWLAEHWRE